MAFVASKVHRRSHRSCRIRPRPTSSLLWFSASCMVFLLFLGVVGAAAAAAAGGGSRTGGGLDGKKRSGPDAVGSDVLTITSKNFKETVTEGTWFVKFYTDWCQHCQRLAPTWKELATELKGKVNVGQVNCDRDKALCRRFHVSGYPTLVHVKNRRARSYTKSRSKEALAKFALEGYKRQAAISVLKSPFGPLENFKGMIVEGSVKLKEIVVLQLKAGTPMWMVCLVAVAMLVMVTVVVAVAIVSVKRPKQD